MKKIILFISIIFCAFLIVGCSSAPNTSKGDSYGSIDGDYPDDPGVYPDAPGAEPDYSAPSNKGEGYNKDEELPQAGQITASEWNDNEHYDYWKSLITYSDNDSETEKHYLASYYEGFNSKAPGLNIKNMFKLVLTSNGQALNNAYVTVRHASTVLFKGVTNAAGVLYFFVKDLYDTHVTFDISYNNQTYSKLITKLEPVNTIDIPEFQISSIEILDLALIVDTTGSMSDELNYLKSELKNVLETISKENQNLEIRLALVFYRDNGDEYVTRIFDFTTDLQTQYAKLSEQVAKGGGDTPEAVHDSFTAALNLNWSTDSTKILIDVCDAPPHSDDQILQSVVTSTIEFAEKGIRFIPVICSGSDGFTEFVFRQTALYTGGTYTYVTDHSGIGNNHTDPATPNDVVVEYLNKLLIRLINEYLTGKDIPPQAYNAQEKHTVSFETQDGSKVNVQLVEHNDYLTPVRSFKLGQAFVGWLIKDKNTLFSYDMKITEDLTLQAIWATEPSADYHYTLITFNTNNEEIYKVQFIMYGSKVKQPEDPIKEGYTFVGWYYLKDGENVLFDFETNLYYDNIQLNAVYEKNE